MNLAVMQQAPAGNKMTVLQGPPTTQKIISAVQANMQTQVRSRFSIDYVVHPGCTTQISRRANIF